jgi:hypothetical protein
MQRLDITETHKERAREKAVFLPTNKSITGNARNLYGALGEVLAAEYLRELGHEVKEINTVNFDMIVNGRRCDIKTRIVSKPPRGWYSANIPAYSIKQKTEFYIFLYILKDLKAAFIAGYIEKDEFKKIARPYRAGEYDGFSFKFPCDTYQIIQRQLKQFKRK